MMMEELEKEVELEPILEIVKEEVEVEEPTSVEEEVLTVEELEEQASSILFVFLKELELSERGNLNLDTLNMLIERIKRLKEEYPDNQKYQDSINECIVRMKLKLSEFTKNAPEIIKEEDLEKLVQNLFEENIPISVDLSNINIEKIVELYTELQKAIKSKDLKKETVARGRLIKVLKKEQGNIKNSLLIYCYYK